MKPGVVNKKIALARLCPLEPLANNLDERCSPLGKHNYPNYRKSGKGAGLQAPKLDVEKRRYSLDTRISKLPDTVDGPAGLEAYAKKQFSEGDTVAYYWGDFLNRDCSRFRKLERAKCPRFMSMSNLPCMKGFVMLGHLQCVGVYVQNSEYKGVGQDDITPNVKFCEQQHATMSPLTPYKYVQIIAICDIKIGDTLYAQYTHDMSTEKQAKGKAKGKAKVKTKATSKAKTKTAQRAKRKTKKKITSRTSSASPEPEPEAMVTSTSSDSDSSISDAPAPMLDRRQSRRGRGMIIEIQNR